MRTVALIGPPGSGKSTVGALLAEELGTPLIDTDAVIETSTGRSISEIFADAGETGFRRIEEQVVRRALTAGPGVVSLGGGAVLTSTTRTLLRGLPVAYLEVGADSAIQRIAASAQRPLLIGDNPVNRFAALLHIRQPIYRDLATIRVATDGVEPALVAQTIRSALEFGCM